MAIINDATKTLAVRIVYYGPGLSGKTTNFRFLYFKLDPVSRGDLVCLETDMERTFFFDLLPNEAGLAGEFKVHFHLMTVPGQVFYEESRKNMLKGTDGIVFVADSQVPLLEANVESFDGMKKNLLEHNIDLNSMPLVFQYNKRDLENLIPVETFNNFLNPRRLPYIEASAINGTGVVETLKEIARLALPQAKEKIARARKKPGEKKEEAETVKMEKEVKVDFLSAKEIFPIRFMKIKIESQEEIEKEIERLSQGEEKEELPQGPAL